jgi:hypothetical protein
MRAFFLFCFLVPQGNEIKEMVVEATLFDPPPSPPPHPDAHSGLCKKRKKEKENIKNDLN